MSSIKNVAQIVRPHWALILISALTTLAIGVIEPFIVYLLKDLVTTGLDQRNTALLTSLYSFLVLVGIGCMIKYFIKLTTTRFSALTLRDLRERFVSHLYNIPIPTVEQYGSGDLISRSNNDLAVLQRYFINSYNATIYAPMVFICAVSLMMLINWQLMLVSLSVLPLGIYLSNLQAKRLGIDMGCLQAQLGKLNSITKDSIQGISIIKAYNLSSALFDKYKLEAGHGLERGKLLEKRKAILTGLSILMRFGPESLCVLYGSYLMLQGDQTSGELLAYVFLLQFAAFPLALMPSLFGQFHEMTAACNRILEILELPTEKNIPQVHFRLQKEIALQFEHTSFNYPESNFALKDLNMIIPTGKTIGIVGPSGSGKTSIFKLICGFYEIQKGKINLFGQDVTDWNLSDLRDQISIVSQDTFLFSGTIAENINIGKPDATMEDIITAAKFANADPFIQAFADGYQTQVGERGCKLSGGQRQRIALARAFLKNAPIILFDEATSALDSVSESFVHDKLLNEMKGRTVIIISHRLSNIKNADNIMVLKDGCLVESGRHEELLNADGLYKRLYLKEFDNPHDISTKREEGA